MLIVTVGAVLTAALLARAAYRGTANAAADLGSMSHSWVAAYQASLPASSI
jgi:hypothetical protein